MRLEDRIPEDTSSSRPSDSSSSAATPLPPVSGLESGSEGSEASGSAATPLPPVSGSDAPSAASDADLIDAVFEAIASPIRRSILDALVDGEPRAAAEVAAVVDGVSASSASRHLRVLRDAGLVTATKVGRSLHYTISTLPLEAVHRAWLSAFLPTVAEPAPARPDAGRGAVSDEHEVAGDAEPEPELHGDPGATDDPGPTSGREPRHELDDESSPSAEDASDQSTSDEREPRSAEDLMARISERLGSMPRDRSKRPEPRLASPLVADEGDDAATRRPFARLGRTER